MKIFINYQLSNAFKSAVKRDRLDAIDHMVAGGMPSIKAICFVEAMSKDIADTWNEQKAFCLMRKSVYKSYDTAVLNGFRWYDVL
jgi:hypothetical protein